MNTALFRGVSIPPGCRRRGKIVAGVAGVNVGKEGVGFARHIFVGIRVCKSCPPRLHSHAGLGFHFAAGQWHGHGRGKGQIAEICLDNEKVLAVSVLVEKPGALRFARTVGVEIFRERAR